MQNDPGKERCSKVPVMAQAKWSSPKGGHLIKRKLLGDSLHLITIEENSAQRDAVGRYDSLLWSDPSLVGGKNGKTYCPDVVRS